MLFFNEMSSGLQRKSPQFFISLINIQQDKASLVDMNMLK
jgi:hypothetical protein